MRNKIEKLREDPRGYFWLFLRRYHLSFSSYLTTRLVRLLFALKGISTGEACRFYGFPITYRRPPSRISIGQRCVFRSDSSSNLVGINRKCILATFNKSANIIIGDGSGFSGTVIGAAESIVIGKTVMAGGNCLITDFDWHGVNPELRHGGSADSRPVRIEDNVWLGVNSVVLKGVTIGTNSVVGANSLVVKDIPPNVIAGGNPCRVIKEISK